MVADPRTRLVVIGSGWVGLYIAQYINTTRYAVTVISPHRTSAYTPLLASAACALFPYSCAEESLRSKGRNIKFFKALADRVDFESSIVRCKPAFKDAAVWKGESFDVQYDKLVIAPGCTLHDIGEIIDVRELTVQEAKQTHSTHPVSRSMPFS